MTIFGPFSKDTDFSVERNNNGWSNFRVDDLDWLVASLTASGIALETGLSGARRQVALPGFMRPGFMILRAIQSSCGSRRRIDGERVAPACDRTKVCA